MGKPKYVVQSGDSPVIAVKFAHGSIKSETNRSKMSWQLYKRKLATSSREKQEAILAAELDGMIYRGSHQVDDTCDYYMGVLEPGSDSVHVHPTRFITMHPVMEDVDHQTDLSSKEPEKDWRAKTDDLIKEFGSGKMKKAVERRQKEKLDGDMLSTTTQAWADTAIVDSPIVSGGRQADEAVPATSATSARPPHNIDAKRPEDAYKLSDIVPSNITQTLSEMCQPMYLSTAEEIISWATEKRYPQFIITKLETLSIQENVRLLQCQCLTFLHCLIHMFKLRFSQLRLKNPLPEDWPFMVKSHILHSFTLETRDGKSVRRSCPQIMKDKLLSHILVLCLKLTQFSLELNPLMADLGLPSKRLNTHCQYLGCKIHKETNPLDKADVKFTAELTVPLKFPEQKKIPGKKKF